MAEILVCGYRCGYRFKNQAGRKGDSQRLDDVAQTCRAIPSGQVLHTQKRVIFPLCRWILFGLQVIFTGAEFYLFIYLFLASSWSADCSVTQSTPPPHRDVSKTRVLLLTVPASRGTLLK